MSKTSNDRSTYPTSAAAPSRRPKLVLRAANIDRIPDADPGDPHAVFRSHLKKNDLGKSSSSCKLSFVTRPHRRAMVQELWCASFEEKEVILNVAANPRVETFREQLTRVDYVDDQGKPHHTRVDLHVVMRGGEHVLVSVKYDKKARRAAYRDEVRKIAAQCPREVADRFVVLSRYSFHPTYRACAEAIHAARLGWDPEADAIVLDAANDTAGDFAFGDLVARSRLGGRGFRAAVRLIGDGDILKHALDPIANDTRCRSAMA